MSGAVQLATAVAPLTLDDQIRNAASLVSIALAILILFTNRRLAKLDEDRETLSAWNWSVVGQVLLDLGLLMFNGAVMVAVSPLVVEAWLPELGRQASVMQTLMLVLAAGLLAVAATQLYLVAVRVGVATANSTRQRRNR